MALRADIAARIGRPDLAATSLPQTGTSVVYGASGGGVASDIGASLSVQGRGGLLILAGLVIGLVGFAYWTR